MSTRGVMTSFTASSSRSRISPIMRFLSSMRLSASSTRLFISSSETSRVVRFENRRRAHCKNDVENEAGEEVSAGACDDGSGVFEEAVFIEVTLSYCKAQRESEQKRGAELLLFGVQR